VTPGGSPAERHTTYQLRKCFSDGEDLIEPLDEVTDVDERFGSYFKLTQSPEFRYAEAATARWRPRLPRWLQ